MMIDILSFEGYPIQGACNGQEALEKLRIDADYLSFST